MVMGLVVVVIAWVSITGDARSIASGNRWPLGESASSKGSVVVMGLVVIMVAWVSVARDARSIASCN